MLEDQNYIGNLAVSALRGRNYQNNNIKQNNIAKNNIAAAKKQKIYHIYCKTTLWIFKIN